MENAYVYPPDPINDFDLTGTIGWKKWFRDRYTNANSLLAKTQKVGAKVSSWCGKGYWHGVGCDAAFIVATRGSGKGGKNSFNSIRNPAQDKRLTSGDIDRLKRAGYDIHGLKGGKHAASKDLFKDDKGNVYVKLKSGKGFGESLDINVRQLK